MSLTTLYSSNVLFRATLKTVGFGLSAFAAIFCASAGYGLLKLLLSGIKSGADIGIAEFSTHAGLTVVFFLLAGTSAYVAKTCLGKRRVSGVC
jgi:hypothetical protein